MVFRIVLPLLFVLLRMAWGGNLEACLVGILEVALEEVDLVGIPESLAALLEQEGRSEKVANVLHD